MFRNLLLCTIILSVTLSKAFDESSSIDDNALESFDRSGGKPLGFLHECPGSEYNSTVSVEYLYKRLFVVVHMYKKNGDLYRKRYYYSRAAKGVGTDPYIKFKKRKTFMFIAGFMDHSTFPFSRMSATAFAKLGYNVLILDTNHFTTFEYPIASRFTRLVGQVAAQLLKDMYQYGLDPDDVVLLGFSLGAHTAGFVGKYYYKLTGKKIGFIIGGDPAGPCFRNNPKEERLSYTDAKLVEVIHANIDIYGMASAIGHVDFYLNGGEYQPPLLNLVPCLSICSHFRVVFVLLSSLYNPNKFYGIRCKSVQHAREDKCYDESTPTYNVMGINPDKTKPGIYYVPTSSEYPYFLGLAGLKKRVNIWKNHVREVNEPKSIVLDDKFAPALVNA